MTGQDAAVPPHLRDTTALPTGERSAMYEEYHAHIPDIRAYLDRIGIEGV